MPKRQVSRGQLTGALRATATSSFHDLTKPCQEFISEESYESEKKSKSVAGAGRCVIQKFIMYPAPCPQKKWEAPSATVPSWKSWIELAFGKIANGW
jgi:hypothetical protein